MKTNFVDTKKMLIRLLLAIPLGLAIHAFAFTPSTANAEPCQACNFSNFCQNVPFGGGHTCIDSGDGNFCWDSEDCPDVIQPPYSATGFASAIPTDQKITR